MVVFSFVCLFLDPITAVRRLSPVAAWCAGATLVAMCRLLIAMTSLVVLQEL